jgi:acetylornithine deacetylase/succinyl-diaminopimelate desuccinylase-like protein
VAELGRTVPATRGCILKEAIRIPADEVDRPIDAGGDPRAGLSNHEGMRLTFLRNTIIDVQAVRHADDVWFDDYGNLVWVARDPFDGVAPEHQRVIYFDGHSDTVQALREQWHAKLGGAVDPYDGLLHPEALDGAALHRELGWVPPEDEWQHLVFGRGSADQLAGVVAEIIATKILLELIEEGALHGCTVRAYATAAEEDNDGGGPRYVIADVLPGAGPELVPDVVVLTEGTGDAVKGALGIYRGQRGRMQIEVTVVGRSCHGSMPFEGLNPLEHGGAIIAEAARRHVDGDGFTTIRSWAVALAPRRGPICRRPATARFPTVSRSGSTGDSRWVRHRRRPSPTSTDSMPWPPHGLLGSRSPSTCRATTSAPGAVTRWTTPRSTRVGSRPRITRPSRLRWRRTGRRVATRARAGGWRHGRDAATRASGGQVDLLHRRCRLPRPARRPDHRGRP